MWRYEDDDGIRSMTFIILQDALMITLQASLHFTRYIRTKVIHEDVYEILSVN